MKNKSVMVTGIANFAGSSSVKEPVREMDMPERPCHVALGLSGRGELEITDVNNEYIGQGAMGYRVLDGYWSDAGTFEILLQAGILVRRWRRENYQMERGAGF